MAQLTAEEFLRDKLASEIEGFGDGTTGFHTRDIQHLLHCLEEKDNQILYSDQQCIELISKINFDAEEKLKQVLTDCMERNNWSAEERLRYIRKTYKEMFEQLIPQYKNK